MEIFISVLTSVVLSLIAIGFALGFFRGWVKSLSRLACVIVSFLVALFVSPALSKGLIGKFVNGTTFSGFGVTFDVEDSVSEILGDSNFANDLFSSTQTTTNLAVSIINVLMNVVAFLLIFFAIYLVSLLVFWIVSIILGVKKKKQGEFQQKTASYWWLKVLGGGIGIVSSVVVCLVIMSPVFGAMNICNKFLKAETTSASATASAVGTQNVLGAGIYYTEDENIGQVEGLIADYEKVKKTYDKSFIGGFFKYTGVSKLGSTTFNYLTNVKTNNLKVNVTDEMVAVIRTYNIYKTTFVAQKFDLANNDSLDGVLQIYEIANESKIVESYIEEFIPKFCDRWINGEKFLGIAMPISGEFEPLAKEVLKVFNTTNSTRIKDNVTALVGAIKVANNNEIIKNVRENKDLIEILSNNQTFVKEEVLQISSTNELKKAMPKIIHEFVVVAYDKVVGGEANFEQVSLTDQQIDAIVWKDEAMYLQDISTNVLAVYNATQENKDSKVMIDLLVNIGQVMDSAKTSALISGQFKVFIDGFIASDLINLEANVKTVIRQTIADHWTNKNYSYAETFAAIQETAKIAQSVVSGNGSIDLSALSGVLTEIIADNTAKETINQILDSNIVSNLVGDSHVANSLTDVLDTLVNDTDSSEELNQAISSGQQIVNILNGANADGGLTLEGSTTEEKTETSKTILEEIAKSDAIMGLLNESSNASGSAITSAINGVGGDIDILKGAVDDANLSPEHKNIFNNLFA